MPDDELAVEVTEGEADETISLVEHAVAKDSTIEMKVIQPGWGSSGYYSEEVLRRDGPAAWPAGTHMYLDHPTAKEAAERPERSIKDLAAVLITTPEYRESGKAGPGLYAKATVLPQFRETLDALAPHIGVSIRATGTFSPGEASGRKGRIVERIAKGLSIDFVTKPGAGGRVMQILESLRQNDAEGVVSTDDMSTDQSINEVTSNEAAPVAAPAIEVNMELQEAQERIDALQAELAESNTARDEAVARADRAELALAVVEAEKVAADALATVALPDAAKERIRKQIAQNPPLTEGKLDAEAIKARADELAVEEAEYLSRVTGAVIVKGQGEAKPVTESRKDEEIQASLADKFSRMFGLSESAAKDAAKGH